MITLTNPIICYDMDNFTFDNEVLNKFYEEMSFRFYS